jgi:predicted PurR-regulated permease PerM
VSLAPPSYQGDMRRFFYELAKVWSAYLRGQLILCIAVGMAVYIAALILGLPNAPILGLLAGLLEFIPNLGPIVAAAPAVIIALLTQSSTFPFLSGLPFALIVAGTYVVIQQVESYYMVPRVMGGSLNLHPVVVIIAVVVGASVAGALGIILAAPLTATLRLVGTYIYGKLFDIDPFPTQFTASQPRPNFVMRVLHPDRLREYGARFWQMVSQLRPHRLQRLRRTQSASAVERVPSVQKTEEEIVHHER